MNDVLAESPRVPRPSRPHWCPPVALANTSYRGLVSLTDDAELLNLAWTLDERGFLATDVSSLLSAELLAEHRSGLPYLHQYFVQDPYGDRELGPAVAAFFGQDGWECEVTCGAGAISLLHALSVLAAGRPLYVVGDVYPDLPHWVAQSGGVCASRHAADPGAPPVDHARALGSRLILVERPRLVHAEVEPADGHTLRELCEGTARQGAVVVVDESYANYCPPAFSAAALCRDLPNLVVLRGLSKAYGLGGLRLAYAVTHRSLTARVRAVVPPMLASSLSIRLGKAVLSLGDATPPLRRRVQVAKAETVRLLTSAGLSPSDLSHPLVPYLMYEGSDAAARHGLESRGILGKLQPLWSERTMAVEHKYRLSVPLREDRLADLRRRLA